VSIAITTSRSIPDAAPRQYWEARARRYATVDDGLPAVCAYGMPRFYNRYVDVLQRRALAPWCAVAPGTSVLELGCGVGRWTRHFVRAGATVVGVDLSPTMIGEARARVSGAPRGACRFVVADIAALALRRRFDLVFGVTVLQHVLEADRLQAAVDAIAAHLTPGGRAVLLEAAPTIGTTRCDHPAFVARDEATYRCAFARAGLAVRAVEPVDPAPFRMRLLPRYRRLPSAVGQPAMLLATLASIPIDFDRRAARVDRSWHKVFVLGAAGGRIGQGPA
jgi:SAM-dependent methyltransferase